jgi:hypothetical protein
MTNDELAVVLTEMLISMNEMVSKLDRLNGQVSGFRRRELMTNDELAVVLTEMLISMNEMVSKFERLNGQVENIAEQLTLLTGQKMSLDTRSSSRLTPGQWHFDNDLPAPDDMLHSLLGKTVLVRKRAECRHCWANGEPRDKRIILAVDERGVIAGIASGEQLVVAPQCGGHWLVDKRDVEFIR